MDDRVKHAIELMEEQFVSPLCSVRTIAAQLQISPSLLRQLFASDLSDPPSRYLKRLRLKRAEALVIRENISIKEVMARVGLNDLSHFVRDFAAAFGCSPAKYRERARGNRARELNGDFAN